MPTATTRPHAKPAATRSQRRWPRRLALTVLGLAVLLVLVGGSGVLWLRSSLPQLDGTITLTASGLQHAVSIGRDDDGYVAIRADSDADAAFALGFAHAQDRLFQMDGMRRLGSGRLAEIIGPDALISDRRMRVLGLRRQAQEQYDHASPALKERLDAYANGVNAYLTQHRGAWPPEFVLLNYRPESWSPVDSLLWGRLMALQLANNAGDELLNAKLKAALPDDLFRLLMRRGAASSALDGPANTNAASNNWVVAGSRTASGKPILANDPHLGLLAPATWYLARVETPTGTLVGATAPGLPLLIIGSNGHVAWGFTTTMSDAEDIFDEKLDPRDANLYLIPGGSQPFETHLEIIKVKGRPDEHFMARATRHGPVISDTGLIRAPAGHALALAWTGELPDDRTAEALLKMNRATSAADFRVALQDFATPQQNVVFADVAGATGFMAPGRIPQRRNLYEQSRLPVPGWTADADWTGVIPFDALPQQSNPVDGWFATANNDVSGYAKGGFYGMGWDLGYRYHRIADRLATISKMSLADSVELQHDLVAGGLLPLLKAWLPKVSGHADVTAALLAWDGQMRRDRAEPLIVTSWVDHLAHRLMAGRLGELYVNWWFWQLDILKQLTSDEHWCDDPTTAAHESCGDQLSTSLDDALADLGKTYGSDWSAWRWGNAHRMTYESPFWRNVPLANKLLRGTLPDDGDNMTIDCATALPSLAGDYPAIHGPSMRFSVDMAEPLSPVFALAGGQSGNPLSPHYDDQLPAWRDGLAKPIATTITHHLVLQPFPGAP